MSKSLTHTMPSIEEDEFLGRADEVTELKEALLESGARAPLILLVEGIAGVGKTWLTSKLLADEEIHQRFPDKTFWVPMEPQRGSAQREDQEEKHGFALLTEQVFPERSEEKALSRYHVRRALERKRVLLVLDGVEKRIDLDEWMLVDPIVGKVLMTTRRRDLDSYNWRGRVWQLSLHPLGEELSRSLLTRNFTGEIEEAQIEWLLGKLDGLPLALEIANRVAHLDQGFAPLVRELRQGLAALETEPIVRKQDSLRLTFRVSYSRLSDQSATLFRLLGIFPQPFNLKAVAYVQARDRVEVEREFRELVRMGLARRTEAGLGQMHSLLHLYAYELANENDTRSLPGWEERFAEYYLMIRSFLERFRRF